MKRVKLIILVMIVLVGGGVLVRLWVNLEEGKVVEKKEEVPKVSTESADMSLEKIRLVEDKHGQKTWELEARAAQQNNDENILLLEDLKVTYYAKGGRSFILSGKKGRVNQGSRDMELIGDVRLTSSDGYTLKTNSLKYNHGERKVTTADPVEIEGDQMHLVGRGMQVDMEAQTLRVLNRVNTQWKRGRQ